MNFEMIKTTCTPLYGAATLACLLGTAPAMAQIEEIVVTAQRRAESLQDVPISIKAFSGEKLDQLGVTNSEQIMEFVPNAGVVSKGGSKYNFFVRGVGSNDFHANVVGAVGVYLDDVALNSPFAVGFSLMDVERVEVLRGPQNTLYGRNTTGGAVNFISRKPEIGKRVTGYFEAGYGSFQQVDLEGAVGFSLGENAAARLSLVSNTRDGVVKNLTKHQDDGSTDKQAARLQVLWQPGDDAEILLNLHGGKERSNPMPFKGAGLQDPNDPTSPCAIPADELIPQNNHDCVNWSGFSHQTDDWENVFNNLEHRQHTNRAGFSLDASWDVGDVSITSLTAFDSLEVLYNEDDDAGPTDLFSFYQDGDYEQWSQELRLQSLSEQDFRWLGGLYWFREEAKYASLVRRTASNFAPSGPGIFNRVAGTVVEQHNEVLSLYGQLEYDIRDDITAIFGLRLSDETKKGTNDPSVRCVGPIGGPPFCPLLDSNAFIGLDLFTTLPVLFSPGTEQLDLSETEWGGRFALDWNVNDETLIYASVSRGFKAGGFSLAAQAAFTGSATLSVEAETLMAYEVGFKSTWIDQTLQLNGAGFFYDWENLQTFDITEGEGVPRLINLPKASIVGAEFEIEWTPAEDWYVSAGVGFLDGEIDESNAPGIADGNELPNTPGVTFNGLIQKDFRVGNGTLSLQANIRYKDSVTYDLSNEKNLSQASYSDLNARAAYLFGESEQYEVGVWAKNLTEEEVCTSMNDGTGITGQQFCVARLSEPTYGVRISILF